ncbi:hypothetical protein BLOT_015958 [Blomia tropicalis]|nr:hypothetical protein BLOT_015958 [Blomia tropicalis]
MKNKKNNSSTCGEAIVLSLFGCVVNVKFNLAKIHLNGTVIRRPDEDDDDEDCSNPSLFDHSHNIHQFRLNGVRQHFVSITVNGWF